MINANTSQYIFLNLRSAHEVPIRNEISVQDEVSLKNQRNTSELSVSHWSTTCTSKLLANSGLFASLLLSSLFYWQIIERETSELEKLRLEKSAVKSQIDEKVGKKVPIKM